MGFTAISINLEIGKNLEELEKLKKWTGKEKAGDRLRIYLLP